MFILVLLFIALPIAELYVIIKVGGAIGVLPTLGLLILDSIVGAAVWRHQGRAAWRRFNEALEGGRVPAKEVFDGALIILGGALLLTPGFITDFFGLLCLLPPTRAGIRRALTRVFGRRMAVGQSAVFWGESAFAKARHRPDPHGPKPGDIDGTGHEVDEHDHRAPPALDR